MEISAILKYFFPWFSVLFVTSLTKSPFLFQMLTVVYEVV